MGKKKTVFSAEKTRNKGIDIEPNSSATNKASKRHR